MSQMSDMEPFNKRKIILRIILGYLFTLSLLIGIVCFSLVRLDKIKGTVDNLTNKLAVTRSLSQAITGKIRLVRFYAERYRRFYNQGDLDQFNSKILDLKKGLNELDRKTNNREWKDKIQNIQRETHQYEIQFKHITKLIMLQQSLLSTIFLKQELLIENQLSAIRINVGIIQEPDIFYSFGNARNAFQLMQLYQSKYLHEDDEKYYVMFKRNYEYASNAFSELKTALEAVSENSRIGLKAVKANVELKVYYETFLKIHSAGTSLKKSSKKLDLHELEVTKIASTIASQIEEKYKVQNQDTHRLVRRTQVELVVAVIIAILLSLGLIFVVSRKITAPLFREMQREAEELKKANQKAEILAVTDTLTGLNNRLKLDQELNKEFQRAERYGNPFSIILLDLDKFKSVNDTFGHSIGDQTLKEVSSILSAHSRKTDVVGRWGGEEFLFICPETNRAGALHLAEIIRNAIETHDFPIIGKKTSSFGVACYIDGDEIQTIMERADKALYKAKAKGRNRIEVS